MQDLLDQAAENTTFSKPDLKSAYHQIPLHRKDMSFTAFEVNGRLFEFTRLPFGVTNAVATFQREMTAFVRLHNLKRTHPYLDDVIIGGRSEEEHQENLKNFLKAAEIEGLTLNKAKCVFGCKTVPMLGHIVGAGSKRPDPSRIKTLMDFPIPENSSQLKRLLGFFAYNAKWIADSPARNTESIGLSAQSSFSAGYRNSQERSCLCRTLAATGKTSLSFSKPMHPGPVSERHSLKTTNLSVSSRELLNIAKWRTRWLNGKLWLSFFIYLFLRPVTDVTGSSSHRSKGPLLHIWTQLFQSEE